MEKIFVEGSHQWRRFSSMEKVEGFYLWRMFSSTKKLEWKRFSRVDNNFINGEERQFRVKLLKTMRQGVNVFVSDKPTLFLINNVPHRLVLY